MSHRTPRYLLLTLMLATLAGQGGCAWLQHRDPPPQVLPPGAGLEQVIGAVNHNNSQIQSLYSDSATLSIPHAPILHAHFAYQRPCLFRLRADTSITGNEVDLGSNAQLFWFWVKRNEPPAVYYCRHDQFATSQARAMIPIEPSWLIEALGTLEIDPNLQHDGPYPDPKNRNRIWIRTMLSTPEGPPNMKITVIKSVSAWVMEQQIYDAGESCGRGRWPRTTAAIRRRASTFRRQCEWNVHLSTSPCGSTWAMFRSTSRCPIRPRCGQCR